ncbi:MAG: hypothetical protein ACLQJR_28550 [Stellaceae bacterium]
MTLLDVTQNLMTLDRDLTIYAAEPWTPESAAILDEQDERPGYSLDPKGDKTYFIEVFIAQDFLKEWVEEGRPAREMCERLIYYATYDA